MKETTIESLKEQICHIDISVKQTAKMGSLAQPGCPLLSGY